jgi:hypothetical protein
MSATFPITIFADLGAATKRQLTVDLRGLAALIAGTHGASKRGLPLLKLATFGDQRSVRGSLRHDGNVKQTTGLEGDYDNERVGFDEAAALLRNARIETVIYTSPSHRPEAPRWRILCPFAAASDRRAEMVSRADTVLGGVLGRESWRLSQAYYFGRINDLFRIEVIDGDRIDTRSDLCCRTPRGFTDAIGEPRETTVLDPYGAAALASAIERIRDAPKGAQRSTLNGESYSIGRLAGSGGVPADLALAALTEAARELKSYDMSRPWRPGQAEGMVRTAFREGRARPRLGPDERQRQLDEGVAELMAEGVDVDWAPGDG